MVVFFAAWMHLLLLLAICAKFYNAVLSFLPKDKTVAIACIFLLMPLVHRFYSEERIQKLYEKYAKKSVRAVDILLIAALIAIPMVGLFILRWKG
jgi:hypothetical protein